MTETLRQKLISGQPQFGLAVMYESPGVIERIGPDWDWIWIDGQHGELSYTNILQLVRACDFVGCPALVRVPGHEFGSIGAVLDTGAAGVIVPCVDTPEQARAVVEAAKFPPLGKRSFGGRRVIDHFGRSYVETANTDTLLVVQVETPEAIGNVDAIAATPGVDALFLGPDDLLLRRGIASNAPRTRENLEKDMDTVNCACRHHGKFAVMVGANPELLDLSLTMGYHLIVAGGDVSFLAAGSTQASRSARDKREVLISRLSNTGNELSGNESSGELKKPKKCSSSRGTTNAADDGTVY